MYTIEDFDKIKTKVMKYVLYKKRTEQEIKQKFSDIDENILEEVIEYLKEAGYINDINYIERAINEFMALKNLSIKEIKYKLKQKGISKDDIEDYIGTNYEKMYEYEERSAEKIMLKKKDLDENELKSFLYNKGYTEDIINDIIKK